MRKHFHQKLGRTSKAILFATSVLIGASVGFDHAAKNGRAFSPKSVIEFLSILFLSLMGVAIAVSLSSERKPEYDRKMHELLFLDFFLYNNDLHVFVRDCTVCIGTLEIFSKP